MFRDFLLVFTIDGAAVVLVLCFLYFPIISCMASVCVNSSCGHSPTAPSLCGFASFPTVHVMALSVADCHPLRLIRVSDAPPLRLTRFSDCPFLWICRLRLFTHPCGLFVGVRMSALVTLPVSDCPPLWLWWQGRLCEAYLLVQDKRQRGILGIDAYSRTQTHIRSSKFTHQHLVRCS